MRKIYVIVLLVTLGHNVSSYGQRKIQDSGVSVDLQDVYFVDKNHGWAVGDSGTIIATMDGGNTWKIQISSIRKGMICTYFDSNHE